MTIFFPNPSRNFDKACNAVSFVGYDDLFVVNFYVDAGALAKAVDGEYSQSDCLKAFDAQIDLIHKAASKKYSRNSGMTYILKTTDF